MENTTDINSTETNINSVEITREGKKKYKKCPHDRQKSKCIYCKGCGICEHNKQRSICKDCKGGGICEHNKIRTRCKNCGGGTLCEHNRDRFICKDCKGNGICEHNRERIRCKDCKGNSICEHNRERFRCKDCKGGGICEHNRERPRCKDCKGSGICEHNKTRSQCKNCGGSNICKHNKYRSRCKECGGSSLCKSEWCETRKNKKYGNYCLFCFINLFPDTSITHNYKTKEKCVVDIIKEKYGYFSFVCDKKVEDGCSKRRPDMMLDLGSHILIIEVDENKHDSYECSCENKRIMEISKDLNHRPIVFIRFNPDGYVKDGKKIPSCWTIHKHTKLLHIPKSRQDEWNNRIKVLLDQIDYWINNKTEKTIEVIQLFY